RPQFLFKQRAVLAGGYARRCTSTGCRPRHQGPERGTVRTAAERIGGGHQSANGQTEIVDRGNRFERPALYPSPDPRRVWIGCAVGGRVSSCSADLDRKSVV